MASSMIRGEIATRMLIIKKVLSAESAALVLVMRIKIRSSQYRSRVGTMPTVPHTLSNASI